MEGKKGYNIIKTIFMVIGPATMGLYLELVGPALPDLKNKLSASYERIARVLVARSVGYFISSLLGGALADCFPHQIEFILSTAYFLGAVGTAIIPWCEVLWVMALMFHLQGLGEGLIDTCNNSLCARIWGDQAAAPLHALHFGFGVGALLAPVLARPFISEVSTQEGHFGNYNLRNMTSSVTMVSSTTDNSAAVEPEHVTEVQDPSYSKDLYIPYTISSVLTFFMAIIFLALYIYETYIQQSKNEPYGLNLGNRQTKQGFDLEKRQMEDENQIMEMNTYEPDPKEPMMIYENEDSHQGNDSVCAKGQQNYPEKESVSLLQIISPGSCTNGDVVFGVKIFVLIFIYYLNIVGGERAYGKYLYTYATESDSNFTKDEATFLNSLFWLCFTAGRGVTIVLARIFRPALLLSFELSVNVLIGITLCIWGYDVKIVLFICTALLGLTLSPIFPGGMAWMNLYLKLTGVAIAIIFTGGACGGMIYQWLTGWLFDVYGSGSLSFIMVGYAIVLSLTFLLMLITVHRRKSLQSSDNVIGEESSIQ